MKLAIVVKVIGRTGSRGQVRHLSKNLDLRLLRDIDQLPMNLVYRLADTSKGLQVDQSFCKTSTDDFA